MRRLVAVAGGLTLILATATAATALVSKRYEFKERVLLEMGVTSPSGLRLDSVRFEVPATSGDRITRTGGVVTARVAVSNTGSRSLRVGLAIALLDAEGRLLAVASGGNKVASIKPGRQQTFTLIFEGVNAEAHKATDFQISLEAKS